MKNVLLPFFLCLVCSGCGPIDQFWLSGSLRISSREQVAFLHQLRAHQLPVSERTIAIVKDILIQEETPDYVLRGKTGWAVATEPHLGCYVGWLDRADEAYIFALTMDIRPPADAALRQTIVRRVFQEMGLLEGGSRSN